MQEDPEYIPAFFSAARDTWIRSGGVLLVAALTYAETATLLGVAIPGGESLLFTAGLLCGSGVLDAEIGWLLGAVTVAAIAGDFTGYQVGRKLGEKLHQRKDSFFFKKKYLEHTEEFYKKRGGVAFILGRYIPVVRALNPFVAGAAEIGLRRFMLFTSAGSIIWCASIILSSYFLGKQVPWIKEYLKFIIPAIVLMALTPFLIAVWREVRNGKRSNPS